MSYFDFIRKDSNEKRVRGERGFWSRVASRYDGWVESAFKDQYDVFKPKIASYIGSDDTVLEIGTGTGEVSFHIAPIAASVVSVDISPMMIEVAREKCLKKGFGNIIFQVEDGYDLPFQDSSFSRVVAVNSLQTMKDPFKSIAEGIRVLEDGGEFLSITYCYGDTGFLERAKLLKWIILYGLPSYWNNFKAKDLISLFSKAGFEVVEKEFVWESPKVLFLRCRKSR